MESIRTYVLSVVTAAMLCAILSELSGRLSTTGKLLKMVSGMVLALCMLGPLAQISFDGFFDRWDSIQDAGEQLVHRGAAQTDEAMARRIISETEAYILSKANALGAEITVSVSLTADPIPVPNAVTVRGSLSAYAKTTLSAMLTQDLGIPREAQTWM